MPKVLDKKGLLEKGKLKSGEVDLDGDVAIISEVRADEYMEVFKSLLSQNEKGEYDGEKFISVLATRSIQDKKGTRLFTDDEAPILRGMSSTVYSKLIFKVRELNGLGSDSKN